MPTTMKPADVVVIGLGWTGSILSMELASEGLKIVALERGKNRDTSPDFTYPKAADELKYGIRGELFRRLSLETVTVRYRDGDVALPYRQYNAFLLPDNVGGAGLHWNGQLYRPSSEDLKFYTHNVERYGRSFLPEGMTIQDYDVTYEDLEPYFDRFEYLNGASGQAGNIKGTITPGGNPFEGPRSRDYPTPPVADTYPAILFANAAKQLGHRPFPQPSANCSQPFTNGYNVRLGPCNLCVTKMDSKSHSTLIRQPADHFNVREYQTTHTTGGVITGADPNASALNRYLQSWDWSEPDVVQFLEIGRNARTAAFGGMSDVITHSTQRLHGEDLWAISHYLKTLPGSGGERAVDLGGRQTPVIASTRHAFLQIVNVAPGSPLGREGAPREIGAMLAGWFSRRARLAPEETRVMVACGAGAVLAAVYNVPLAGAVFILEAQLRTVRTWVVIPAFTTSCIATAVAWAGLGDHS